MAAAEEKEETFEQYIKRNYDIKDLEPIQKLFNQKGLDEMLTNTLHLVTDEDTRDQYDILRGVLVEHYYALSDAKHASDKKTITEMLHAMYELDTKCSSDSRDKVRDDKEDDDQAERNKFKGILSQWLPKFKDIKKDYILYFAELIFRFNGYQAPVRNNISQALHDAYGLSDLFGELLDEISADKKS